MELTGIIYRLFAWVRPLLWYYHRLGWFLRVAIACFEDDAWCLRLFDNPAARARVEGMLADAEHCLDIAIGLRARELLGLPAIPEPRPGLRQRARIHTPPSLLRLAARLDRLIDRHNAIERLARLRAQRLRREAADAPVMLEADHRPQDAEPSLLMMVVLSPLSPATSYVLPTATAGLHIRAPP